MNKKQLYSKNCKKHQIFILFIEMSWSPLFKVIFKSYLKQKRLIKKDQQCLFSCIERVSCNELEFSSQSEDGVNKDAKLFVKELT